MNKTPNTAGGKMKIGARKQGCPESKEPRHVTYTGEQYAVKKNDLDDESVTANIHRVPVPSERSSTNFLVRIRSCNIPCTEVIKESPAQSQSVCPAFLISQVEAQRATHEKMIGGRPA
jgi:hypothetical protein